MTGTYRVDWLTPGAHTPHTTWHATEDAALDAAHWLRIGGARSVVAWRDWAVYAA